MKPRLPLGLVLGVGLTVLTTAPAAPHIYYDDAGNIPWKANFTLAMQQAQKLGRPIFIHLVKDKHQPSEDQVSQILRDPELGRLLSRYCICIAIDADKQPKELTSYFDLKKNVDRLVRSGVPAMMVVTPRGISVTQLSGNAWNAKRVTEAVQDTLEDHFPMNKQAEAQLNKQLDFMEKALEKKATWSQASRIFAAIMATPGYGKVKDLAHEAMDKAQVEPTKSLAEAYNHARQDEYKEAKDLTAKVQKDFFGLPIADDAKAQLGALKLLEGASKAAGDDKTKGAAVKQLDQVINLYGDTPYAALAISRRKDLAPAKK